ncbi:OprD family outer membrane porin [Pseudomonas silesiensis]
MRPLTGDESEWERNLTVSYVIQRGRLKDLSIALHHCLSLQMR